MSGSLKYVYPQYQMAPVQATPTGVQAATGVQSANLQQVQAIPAVPAVPAVPGGISAAPAPPAGHHATLEHNHVIPPGELIFGKFDFLN